MITNPRSRVTMPVTCSHRFASIRRSTSRSKPRPRGRTPVTHTAPSAAAQHEVVPGLTRRLRKIAKEVATTKVSDERDRPSFELPRFERQRSNRRGGCQLGGRDAGDVQHELDSRPRPRLASALFCIAREAGIPRFESSHVDELAAHFNRPALPRCLRGIQKVEILGVGTQHETEAALHELAAEQNVLKVKVAREIDGARRSLSIDACSSARRQSRPRRRARAPRRRMTRRRWSADAPSRHTEAGKE